MAYCNRALISERALDYDTALDCYQQAYELSHGNSQIRREFNRLSSEAGPQGFMFSRAGLARLYMRGDLLTQAIQEWEAVLALSPERLDARTGLLETCWRESHYDRVEQLATQILQEVPGCLKALLLLAYVNSAKNMQRAQEFLKRAETLDPDLLMAQELFSDLMGRQPAEPFLQLLKKAPVTVETSQAQSGQPAMAPVSNRQDALAQLSSGMPALPAAWNDANWASAESDVTLVKAKQENQLAPEASPMPAWSSEAAPALDVWSVLEGSKDAGLPQNGMSAVNPSNYSQAIEAQPTSTEWGLPSQETWSPEPSTSVAQGNNQKEAELSPWENAYQYDGLEEQGSGSGASWENMPGSVGDSGIWGNTPKEGANLAPPAWLNMLTQSEIQQLNDGGAPEPAPIEKPVAAVSPVAPVQPKQKEAAALIPEVASDDDEEGLFFGPELLKAMGAASIEDEASAQDASLSNETEEKQPSYEAPQVYEPAPVAFKTSEPDVPFYENGAEPVRAEEYDLLTTLEGLEAGLLSQGFVPLQPNSLQAIAKTQEVAPAAVPKTPELMTPQEDTYQNGSYLSALNESGNFAQEPDWLTAFNAAPASLPQQEEQAYATPADSSWSAAYASRGTSPLPSVQEEVPIQPAEVQPAQSQPEVAYQPQEKEPASPIFGIAQSDWSQMDKLQEAFASPSPAPATSSETGAQQVWQSAAYNNNPLLNSELETTMKRPAVRLQPMQAERLLGQNDTVVAPAIRPRVAEQAHSARNTDSNVSYQERLLKGYQHQLVGDYDEAMQEYRVIIRHSPELLSEVVSNVRALLKLAPKYSTGYRVLGDAYMRQGEYLQAMESYNKALTMAKRAKG